jgi:hypothetical protein
LSTDGDNIIRKSFVSHSALGEIIRL